MTTPALTAILSLTGALAGALIGLFSGLLLESRRRSYSISGKIIDTYLEIRRELCDQLSDLATLKASSIPGEDQLLARRDVVANLVFRYYDFLPKEVLQEINCLHACLGDRENRIYVIRGDELRLANDGEIGSLITGVSLFENSRYYAYAALLSADRNTRRALAINLQARRVLKILNNDLTIRSLVEWSKNLRK